MAIVERKIPTVGDVFSSFDEFEKEILNLGEATFTTFVKVDCKRFPSDSSSIEVLPYKFVEFVCKRGGKVRPSRGRGIRQKKSTVKCRCPVRIRAWASKRPDGTHVYKVTQVILEHNHSTSPLPDTTSWKNRSQIRHLLETKVEPLVITSQVNGIRTVCLNDPRKRNALSLAMLRCLHEEIRRDTEDLRVIVIKANGPVFSAGHDLKELTQAKGSKYHQEVFSTCSSVMNLVQDIPVPVIAQVQGLATAAGCQLVASCDIAVASETSKFATPGVSVGLFCTTPGVAVGRSVPRKVAMEMLFTGHPISAQDALLHGLVSRVVPDNEVEQETKRIAERICETSKSVVALGKASFYAQMALERKTAYSFAENIMVENLTLPDGQEGIQAFIDKRKPKWK